jgi:hypothetical protein
MPRTSDLAARLQFRDNVVHHRFDLRGLPLILDRTIDQRSHVLLALLPIAIPFTFTGHSMMMVARTTGQRKHGHEPENILLNALHGILLVNKDG